MIELKDKINFHNFMLDLKPESWFKREDDESVTEWLVRTAYDGSNTIEKIKWRSNNRYWLSASQNISLSVLSFLAENKMSQEELEDLCGFDIDLHGSYDWKISELKRLEGILNVKLL